MQQFNITEAVNQTRHGQTGQPAVTDTDIETKIRNGLGTRVTEMTAEKEGIPDC